MKSFLLLAALLFSFGAHAQDSFELNQDGGRFGHDDRGPGRGDDNFGDDFGRGRGPGRGHGPDFGRPGRTDDQMISCSSDNHRLNSCQVDGLIRDVRLVRQRSSAPCVEGRTFGFDRNSIWVSGGCRGDFLVSAERFHRPEPRSESVDCKSQDYRYASCSVRGRIEEVRIERQLSKSACIEGQSFGFDRDYIWVDQGCAATFRVYLR